MKPQWVPKWVWLAALFVLAANAAVFALLLLGRLPGTRRNLVPLALVGGIVVLVALGAYLLRYCPGQLPPTPARLGLGLLTLIAVALVAVYAWYVRPFVTLPYDLANWSEGFFITDIIKWRTGAKLYLPASESNSSTYTPAAPAVSYFLGWLFRHPASIVFYRFLQQAYLALAALFAAASTRSLVRLAMPDRSPRLARLWFVFFALASFLLATNRITNTFSIFLHTDALVVLATSLAFWLLTKHASTRDPRWLWAMAIMPSIGFLVKQYVAMWAAAYLIYLWLDGSYSVRRVLAFGFACSAALGLTIAACFAVWGERFGYWVFYELSAEIISPDKFFGRVSEAAACTILGLLGGAVLLRGPGFKRFFGMWAGWLVMVLAGAYTGGVAYVPTHQAPATMVAGCFFLAALAALWPDQQAASEGHAAGWLRMGFCLLLFFVVFAGLSYPLRSHWSVPSDFQRYAEEIEKEFEGLPPQRVLTDYGDWIYLRDNVLMRDRAPILLAQHTSNYGMTDRLRNREYAKVLIHVMPDGTYSYQLGRAGAVVRELLSDYHKVRVIRRLQGAEGWPSYDLMLGDVAVFEPIQAAAEPSRKSSGAVHDKH
jgi:hypothetical protein